MSKTTASSTPGWAQFLMGAAAAAFIAAFAFWPQINEHVLGGASADPTFVDRINLENDIKANWRTISSGYWALLDDHCEPFDPPLGETVVSPGGVQLSEAATRVVDGRNVVVPSERMICGDWDIEVRLEPSDGFPLGMKSLVKDVPTKLALYTLMETACGNATSTSVLGWAARTFTCSRYGIALTYFDATGTLAGIRSFDAQAEPDDAD